MSKMRTVFKEKRRAVALLSLVLAVLLAAAGGVNALAYSYWGEFSPEVAGVVVTSLAEADGKMSASLTETLNFGAHSVFKARSNGYWGVRAFKLVTTGIGSGTPLKLNVETQNDKNWTITENPNGGSVVINYKSNSSISYGTFNQLMNRITVSFDGSSNVSSASGTVSLQVYDDKSMKQSALIAQRIKTGGSGYYATYDYVDKFTCQFNFYEFAKGAMVPGSEEMEYKTSYATDYRSDYDSDMAKAGSVSVAPDNSGQGRATFSMRIASGGVENTEVSYGKTAWVGYQIKRSSEAFTGNTVKHWILGGDSKPLEYDLLAWDKSTPIPVTVTGLDYGVTYSVRGVVVTDGIEDSPEYTSEISFRYDTPNISSFNIGSTAQVYLGGSGDKIPRISMLTTFNDTNAVGKTYTGVDGQTHNGPALQASLYFTDNRTVAAGNVGGVSTQVDSSQWIKVADKTVTQEMIDENGDLTNNFQAVWEDYPIPASLHDYDSSLPNDKIDSVVNAFKLVVTDLYTGYTTVSYSDNFMIDSSAPTAPTMSAVDADGAELSLAIENEATVGGEGAQVVISIGGSDDGFGSGIREYDYSMFYIPTSSAGSGSTASILQGMKTLTASNVGASEYTPWTSAPLVEGQDNLASITVAKGGYYRILAKAVDNAGYDSEIQEAYFRVDLSMPSTPVVRLAKYLGSGVSDLPVDTSSSSLFSPYDNRVYTDSKVWLFAYSEPISGKTVKSFEFSADGGLTWIDILTTDAQTINSASYNLANYRINAISSNKTVTTYPNNSYTGSEAFTYQIALNLSGLGYDDYNTFLVRAKDTLGNVSLASSAAVMRTTPGTISARASLTHDPIEVALALGKTTLKPAQLIPKIKNAAAQKMNIKMYGANSPEVNALKTNGVFHQCTWTDTVGFTGSCNNSNCPYNRTTLSDGTAVSYYKPELVNVQGITEESANEALDGWRWYDHDTYNTSGGYVETQKKAATSSTPAEYDVLYHFNDTSADNEYEGTGDVSSHRCKKRPHHIVDVSAAKNMSHLRFIGCGTTALTDWLYMPNEFSLPKTILFTMNTAACHFHTYEQAGFWFNTSIRKKQSGGSVGSYVYNGTLTLSGYRIVIRRNAGSWPLKDQTGGTSNCGIELQQFTDQSVSTLMNSGTATGVAATRYAVTPSTSQGNAIQNFCIITEGDNVKVTKREGTYSMTKDNMAWDASGVTQIMNRTVAATTMDGHVIGASLRVDSTNPYTDGSAYGFGPVIGYQSHGCYVETAVDFTNISMQMQKGRKLSEVVTEPSWGNGKAKFIVNISDDAVDDFSDPVLTSQIQWRLNNDQARFIGWGQETNRADAEAFLNRMTGGKTKAKYLKVGMYESTGGNGFEALSTTGISDTTDAQVDQVAEYMTNVYYDASGFDPLSSSSISDQLSGDGGVALGQVYDLENVDNINFSAVPEKYNNTSANPDFPSGRWLMIHDTNGLDGTSVDPRNGKFVDALETNITKAGRYTYYFAPDKDDVANNTLDPTTAIFDFVVNQKPVAQFTAYLDSNNKLVIDNTSYDPDSSAPVYAGSITGEKYVDENGVEQNIDYSSNNIQISGIATTEVRYEFLQKDGDSLVLRKSSDWVDINSANSPQGKTLAQLTDNVFNEASKMTQNDVLTIYMRVTDAAAIRRPVFTTSSSGASGGMSGADSGNTVFAGYKYESVDGETSDVCQRNVGSAVVDIVNPPSATFSLSQVFMYDTANESTDPSNYTITVKRNSSHSQGKYFTLGFKIGFGTDKADSFTALTKSGNDYKISLGGTTYTILKNTVAPSSTGNIGNGTTGSTGGEWQIEYATIKSLLDGYKKLKDVSGQGLILQITESAYGISAEKAAQNKTADSDKALISDSSSRTIFFRTDTYAPAPQVVSTQQVTVTGSGEVTSEYMASSYLEVTNDDQFVEISVSGSADGEGILKGYGYYFYDKNSSGAETAYWKAEGGTLVRKSTTSGLTGQRAAYASLPNTGGTIRIGKAFMRTIPTDSLNIAIFAYDNQTGRSTISGGNETKPTKIEDIKLSQSKPMPTEITVKDNTNAVVATIGNDAAYDSTAKDGEGKSLYKAGAVNKASSTTGYYSASSVTVQFTPKKWKYILRETGELERSTSVNGTEYYEDIYGKADLTGVANIYYTVDYKPTEGDNWWTASDYYAAGKTQMAVTKEWAVTPATTLTISEDGVYRVTAWVVNGSGTVSESRSVEFTIDTLAPTGLHVDILDGNGQPYTSGAWAQKVELVVSGAADLNPEGYRYSIDNGRNFTRLGNIGSVQRLEIPSVAKNIDSGQYTVIIQARDLAGNVQNSTPITVRVDTTPPETPPAQLTASSLSVDVYSEYIVHLNYDSSMGKIYSVQNNVTNINDTEVAVPADGTVRLEFYPNSGYTLDSITYDDSTTTRYTGWDAAKGVYYLDITKIRADHTVTANFSATGSSSGVALSSGVSAAMRASSMRLLNNPVFLSQGDEVGIQEDDVFHNVSVSVVGDNMGTEWSLNSVAGHDGQIQDNMEAVITITPESNMDIDYIEVNALPVTLTETNLVLNNGVYTFTSDYITEQTTIIIHMKKVVTRVLTVSSSDAQAGSVSVSSGFNISSLGGGRYSVPVGAKVTVNLTAVSSSFVPTKMTVTGNGEQQIVSPADGDSNINPVQILTIQAAEGEDSGISLVADFGVASGVKKKDVAVSVTGHGTVTPGNITGTGTISIPTSVGKKITFVPDPGYELSSVTVLQEEDGVPTTVSLEKGVNLILESGSTYSYTLSGAAIINGTNAIEAEFTRVTYAVSLESNGGGRVSWSADTTEEATLQKMPQGTPLTINIQPNDGYRVASVAVRHGNNEYNPGAVSSYTIPSVNGAVRVVVTFAQRTVLRIDTTHGITARADNVKDPGADLDAAPVQFAIKKGTLEEISLSSISESDWTDWSSSYTKTFDSVRVNGESVALEPNAAYTVYLRTRDSVHNVSSPVGATVYTLANIPGTNGVKAADDVGNVFTKSVELGVKTNGNPDSTEYRVYWSENQNMSNSFIANENDGNDGWATLSNGIFMVRGLTPGHKYYFQVMARNADGLTTQINSKDYESIYLSPAAPPANSLYFKEQESPVDGIELNWKDPSGDVVAVELYRDGMHITTLDPSVTTYTDNYPYLSFADAVARYSYAYVNSGGAGNTQKAISYEYYQALQKDSANADRIAMEGIQKVDDVFSETLTYPSFPKKVSEADTDDYIQGRTGAGQNSASIEFTVPRDSALSYTRRYQTYDLYLKAYEPVMNGDEQKLDEKGEPMYTEVAGWNPDDHVETTTIYQSNGTVAARANWEGLNNKYRYKVFVKKIYSTGSLDKNGDQTYGGQTYGTGIEGRLGKQYYVTKDGFGFTYKNLPSGLALETKTGTWPTTGLSLGDYVGTGRDWDDPLHEGYIGFNVSPEIALADDPYANNPGMVYTTDGTESGTKYIRVDQQVNKIFRVDVIAADFDAEKSKTFTIEGEIEGVSGKVNFPAEFDFNKDVAKTLDGAKDNPYSIVFDATGLPNGVYDNIVLKVYDGFTETRYDVKQEGKQFLLVVNRNVPSATVTGGSSAARHPLEVGAKYNKDSLVSVTTRITNTVTPAQTKLAQVTSYVLRDEIKAQLGTDYSGYDDLITKLTTNASVAAKGKALMTSTEQGTASYFNGNLLTQDGAVVAILRVKPNMVRYVKVDETTATALRSDAKFVAETDERKAYLLKEDGAGANKTYWVELDYAMSRTDLNEGAGIAGWLTDNGDDTVTPRFVDGVTPTLKLIVSFGGNVTSPTVDFLLKNPPSAVIQTEKHLGWEDTAKDEYDGYVDGTARGTGTRGSFINTDTKAVYTGPITIGEQLRWYEDRKMIDLDNDGNVITEGIVPDPVVDVTTGSTLVPTPNAKVNVDANEVVNGYYRDRAYRNIGTAETPRYQVYKLVDNKGHVDMTTIYTYIKVDMGIYSSFSKLGLMLSDNKDYDPNDPSSPGYSTATTHYVYASNNGTVPITASDVAMNSEFSVYISNLSAGTTYYLWSFYEIPTTSAVNPGAVVYQKQPVTLTTNAAYSTVYYGFNRSKVSYDEYGLTTSSEGDTITAQIDVLSSNGQAYGDLTVTKEYLKADEFGNLLDAGGNIITDESIASPVALTGDQLTWAQETLDFKTPGEDGSLLIEIPENQASSLVQNIQLRIRDNSKAEGHFVMRMHLSVARHQKGFSVVTKGGEIMDIFVLDANSERTTYKIGILNDPDASGKKLLGETADAEGNVVSYDYTFTGLQLHYTETGLLSVPYINIGTGDLDNITATVYNNATGLTGDESEYFEVEGLDRSNLLKSLEGDQGTIEVHPASNLGDGVYEGWLIVKADSMKEADYVKIHLRQVVGQSTLAGRIYVTPDSVRQTMASEAVGVSTIKLYRYGSYTWTNGVPNLPAVPDYSTQTDKFGYYEIPNIVTMNGERYQVIVERDGFIEYNSIMAAATRNTPAINSIYNASIRRYVAGTDSLYYQFDLCLRGGDVNLDGKVDSSDLSILTSNYGKVVSHYVGTSEYDLILRCDFNRDGIVSSLDRAFVMNNYSTSNTNYTYAPYTGTPFTQ